jgi:hypothetical protein
MNTLYAVHCLETALVFTVFLSFYFVLLQFNQYGLIQYHLIGGEEGADESTEGIQNLGYEVIAGQF